nr:protein fmp32, mitochondrial [Quercus suber]
MQGHHFSLLQHETEKLRNDIEKMRSELRYEIDKVTAGQRLDLNLERGRIRDELANQNAETNNLTNKLDREIHALRAQLEAAKYDVIKYCIASVSAIPSVPASVLPAAPSVASSGPLPIAPPQFEAGSSSATLPDPVSRDADEVGHWEEVGDGFVGEDKEGGASGDKVISCRDADEVGHWEEVGDGFVGEDKEGGASGDKVISCETKEEDGEGLTVITKGASDWVVILEGILTNAFFMARKEFSSNTTWWDK